MEKNQEAEYLLGPFHKVEGSGDQDISGDQLNRIIFKILHEDS